MARFGGDEFVVLLPETNLQQGHIVAERILNAAHSVEGVTVSIGIAEATLSMSGIEALMRFADRALYQAMAGKNCIVDGARIELPERPAAAE